MQAFHASIIGIKVDIIYYYILIMYYITYYILLYTKQQFKRNKIYINFYNMNILKYEYTMNIIKCIMKCTIY